MLHKIQALEKDLLSKSYQLEKFGNYAVYQNSMTPLGYYHESNVKADTAFIISAGSAGGN